MPDDFLKLLAESQRTLDEGFAQLPPNPVTPLGEAASEILERVATRLQDNYPYGHPLYAGQMLKPPHPIARAAYALAMSVNPNNHALDGGRASSAMEIEAVAALAKMYHWPQHLGHLSSGGTFANLEALWIAGQLGHTEDGTPKAVAASDQAHYTHNRISGVLGLPFISIPTDECGRMDLTVLESLLETGKIGTVVATLGTTGIGSSEATFDAAGQATRAVGWADQNDVGDVSFEGDTADVADGNEIMIKFTYTGDTDLSGTVDATDSANFSLGLHGLGNGGNAGWEFGDFDYSGGKPNSNDSQAFSLGLHAYRKFGAL